MEQNFASTLRPSKYKLLMNVCIINKLKKKRLRYFRFENVWITIRYVFYYYYYYLWSYISVKNIFSLSPYLTHFWDWILLIINMNNWIMNNINIYIYWGIIAAWLIDHFFHMKVKIYTKNVWKLFRINIYVVLFLLLLLFCYVGFINFEQSQAIKSKEFQWG